MVSPLLRIPFVVNCCFPPAARVTAAGVRTIAIRACLCTIALPVSNAEAAELAICPVIDAVTVTSFSEEPAVQRARWVIVPAEVLHRTLTGTLPPVFVRPQAA